MTTGSFELMPALRLLPEFETALRALPGIRAASVVTGPDSHPTEIHVLARPGKAAKQVVRDVQSVAMAQFDLDVDHRIISVVQFDEEDAPLAVVHPLTPVDDASGGPAPDPGGESNTDEVVDMRPVLSALNVRIASGQAEVTVVVSCGGEEFSGSATGPATGTSRSRVVAEAAVAALTHLLGLPVLVDSAQVVAAGTRQVAVVVLILSVPRSGEQLVVGSALVRGDEADSVARAVLGALNRRLTG